MFKRLFLTATMALTLAVTFAGTVSAAPAQTATAPTPCVQSLSISGYGAGFAPGQIRFGIDFTATCPGRILVGWQALAANGHVVWKSEDHNFIVSTTTMNDAMSSTWFYGKTSPGTYDVYVTLASQNGKVRYFQTMVYPVVVP